MNSQCKLLLILLILFLPKLSAQVFEERTDLGVVEYGPIDEASGLAASRKNENVLWLHNDSGDLNRLFAMNTSGEHLGIYTIVGATNRDWEDIAVGPGPASGEHYIYIAEIGDNNAVYDTKYIYRVLEPVVDDEQSPVKVNITDVDIISFEYPDGNRDAETMMVDPLNNDIYIVSKREDEVRVYQLAYPQSTSSTITATHVETLELKAGLSTPGSWTVAGDISFSGLEILIKTRAHIFYWQRNEMDDLWDAFSVSPDTLPYTEEPQGEAVAWAPDSRGYYTVSEEVGGTPAHLYFYERVDDPFPVELTSFTATLYDDEVIVKWQTETEVNNFGFDIEESINKVAWQKIGFIPGAGNSNSPKSYTFTVDRNQRGESIYYRLKQIDNDGSYNYSDVTELNLTTMKQDFVLLQNYPNPFNPITTINYFVTERGFVQLKLYDIIGNEILVLVNEEKLKGKYSVNFDGSSFSSGVYIYSVKVNEFFENKKMILLR
ncbi:MAG: T9SS type A sorting domain-containing protein [Ignavibacteria bacterium]|jgi:hypothetical protein